MLLALAPTADLTMAGFDALDVTSATLDDPDAVLARAEATNGLGYVALTP